MCFLTYWHRDGCLAYCLGTFQYVYGTVENIAIQTECTIQIVECFLYSLHLVVRLYTRVSVFTINLVFFCMTSTLYSDQNTYQPIGEKSRESEFRPNILCTRAVSLRQFQVLSIVSSKRLAESTLHYFNHFHNYRH